MKSIFNSEVKSWIFSIVFAIVLAFLVKFYIFAPFIVEGASMEPTLHNEEKLLVNKTIGFTGSIKQGDIVIIQDNQADKHYVKRVIGLPGEKVEMKNDSLYIDDKKVKEPYLKESLAAAKKLGVNFTNDFGPVQVPKDQYFVMGDNRINSKDSRNGLGLINKDDIIGKSMFVVFPLNEARATK